MKNIVFQSLWIGKKISTMERLAVSSFLHHGHSFHLYVYEDIEGVPEGTVVKDANEIIPFTRISNYNNYSSVSEVFRYRLLLERGGCWVDCDVVCLKPFQFESDHLFASVLNHWKLLIRSRKRYHTASCFIKAPVGSKIMDYCYQEAIKHDPKKLAWGEIGPELLTKAIEKFAFQENVVKGFFCPIRWWNWKLLISGSTMNRRKWKDAMRCSHALHLYNEMWRRNNVDKDATFDKNSIYEQLKQRYLSL